VEDVLQKVADFHASEVMQGFRDFAAWPMPNSPAQADLTIGTSDDIAQMHADRKALITDLLSTLVLEATGPLILREIVGAGGPGAVAQPRHHRAAAQPAPRLGPERRLHRGAVSTAPAGADMAVLTISGSPDGGAPGTCAALRG
jgi:hypothetical protein